MIHTSKEYKQQIFEERVFLARLEITLADNTEIEIDSDSIMEDGIIINDATSQSDSFTIGSAIINSCTLRIDNYYGELTNVEFRDAKVTIYVGLQLSDRVEYLKKGVFTVDTSVIKGNVIEIECLDNMYKYTKPFDLNVIYPISIGALTNQICNYCGVRLATTSILSSPIMINKPITTEKISCLDAISSIATILCTFARINVNGELEFKWYDIDTFRLESNYYGGYFDADTPFSSGDNLDGGDFTFSETTDYHGGNFDNFDKYHNFIRVYSVEPAHEDVVVTGIKIQYNELIYSTDSEPSIDEKEVIVGANGYVLNVTNNIFITTPTFALQVASFIGNKVIGMRFRPINASVLSDPSVEAGDIAYIYDLKGNLYEMLITNVKYKISSLMSVKCDAESTMNKNAVVNTSNTKTIALTREMVKLEKTARELAIQSLNEKLDESSGLYQTVENDGQGGSIYYLHNHPNRSESNIIWKMTSEAFGVSTDGGLTWNAGLEADGDMILQRLSVVGIDASIINVATHFSVGEYFSVNSNGVLTAKRGKIAGFDFTDGGFTSPNMQLLLDEENPLIWLKSSDGKQHANYEGSLTYLTNKYLDPLHQTVARLDTRQEWGFHGLELYEEALEHSTDNSGIVTMYTKYGIHGIEAGVGFDEEPRTFAIFTDFGTITFYDGGVEISNNYGVLQLGEGSISLMHYLYGNIDIGSHGTYLYNAEGVYANYNRIDTIGSTLSTLESDVASIKFRLGMV